MRRGERAPELLRLADAEPVGQPHPDRAGGEDDGAAGQGDVTCAPSHDCRLVAVASTGSARPEVSSRAGPQRAGDARTPTASRATTTSVSARYESTTSAAPPGRNSAISGLSATYCSIVVADRAVRHAEQEHARRAQPISEPRCSRQARPSGEPRAARRRRRPGRDGDAARRRSRAGPAARPRPATSTAAATSEQQQRPPAVLDVRAASAGPSPIGESQDRVPSPASPAARSANAAPSSAGDARRRPPACSRRPAPRPR